MTLRPGLALAATCVIAGCSQPDGEFPLVAADRVLLNARVYTVDADRSWAQAVAIDKGRIAFVGSDDQAGGWIGEHTDVIDLDGQMLLPGFHDAHTHLLIGVYGNAECDLLRIATRKAVLAKLRECADLDGIGEQRWIVGGGWGEWLWPDAGPTREELDAIFPDRPVYLVGSYGHSAWVNSRAIELAGIDANTVPGEGGVIIRDPVTGEATGTLQEAAMTLVIDILPAFSHDYEMERVRDAIDLAHAWGVTAVIEPGADKDVVEPILGLYDAGDFDLRAVLSLSPRSWHPGTFGDEVYDFLEQRDAWRRPGLDVDSVKIYMDGVIETATSPLLEPYTDPSVGNVEPFYPQETVNDFFTRFDQMGLQIHVHAIGDAAVRMALDGFEAMRAANGVSGNRHHMTHLQLIHEDDRPRFAELDIGATFQALWAYPDETALQADIPLIGEERTYQMYPLAGVHNAGGRLVGASDYWVTQMEPQFAIETAMTRQDPWDDGGPVLNADERVDLATMLAAYTINGAYTMGLDHEQGSIEVGKRADLVVLDRDLFAIEPYAISDARVTMTIFDGRIVYQRLE